MYMVDKMSEFNFIIKPDEDDSEAAEIFVEGRIGDKSYKFILDTGSARTTIQCDDYTSTFDSIKKSSSSGAYGISIDDLITVPYVELGPILKKNFTIARMVENSPDKRNLIGMDLLKDFRCHFIFDKNSVMINPEEEPKIDAAFQDLFLDKKFHPYINVQLGKLIFKAVWDTGAGITIVDMKVIKKYPDLFQEIGKSVGTDSTGIKMETPMFTMGETIIGNMEFAPLKVAGVDFSHMTSSIEVPMDLVLGYNALSKANWLFDFPRRKWAILTMLNPK
jgi:hypothetical protein